MNLIVGLGNPGKKYEKTRHNVGFMAMDMLHNKLASQCQMSDWNLNKKFNAYTAGCTINGEKIILAKPTTFMNRSGEAVQLIAHFYKLTPEDIVVFHDDKDIMLGDVKIQFDRGHAGHNGIKSIAEHINSTAFTRYRIGVASKNEKKMQNIGKFVLGKFGILERKTLFDVLDTTTDRLLETLAPDSQHHN